MDVADKMDDSSFLETVYTEKESRQRHGLAVVSLLNTMLLSGGLVQGWGPLHNKQCHWVNDKTSAQYGKCRNEGILAIQSQVAFTMLSVGSVVFGLLLDRIGPRWTAVSGLTLSVLGNAVMGISHAEWGGTILLWPGTRVFGLALIAGGGMGPYLASMNVANLYSNPAVFIAMNSALFNVAGCVYMILNIPAVDGMHLWLFFRGYAVLALIGVVVTAAFYPDRAYVTGDRPRLPIMMWCYPTAPHAADHAGQNFEGLIAVAQPPSPDLEDACETPEGCEAGGLMKSVGALRRGDFTMLVIYYSVLLSVTSYLSGTLPDIFDDLGDDTSTPEDLYTVYLYPTLSGALFPVVMNPFVGRYIDKHGFAAVFAVSIISAQLFAALTLVPSLQMQLLTFFARSALNATLISGFFAYLIQKLPTELFGTASAVGTAVAALVNLYTIPLSSYTASSGDYTWPAVAMIVGVLPLLYFPFTLHRERPSGPDFEGLSRSRAPSSISIVTPTDSNRSSFASRSSFLFND